MFELSYFPQLPPQKLLQTQCWSGLTAEREEHLMGEVALVQKALVTAVEDAVQEQVQAAEELRLTTPGGRFQVRWDEEGSATALGQLAFFAEFLEVSGLFSRWVEGCPMAYTSPNAPAVTDVLGTWLLSILDGQRRYAHVTGLRGDEVAPEILGMDKIVSDESLRRALAHLAPNQAKRCDEAERAARAAQLAKSTAWMDSALSESVREALRTPWVLDIDTTIKLLFGHQAGAEISYNPTKPGRPSHTLHTYWIGNLRLVLDVEVQGGKAHAAKHSLPRLRLLIERLPPEERPSLVRGDSAFGNEHGMTEMEEIEQPDLFKLRQTAGVKRLIERQWSRRDWEDVGQGSMPSKVNSGSRAGIEHGGWWWCCGDGSKAAWRSRRRTRASKRFTSSTMQTISSFGNMPSWSPTRLTRYKPWASCIGIEPIARTALTS
jgi:hypothetical protein